MLISNIFYLIWIISGMLFITCDKHPVCVNKYNFSINRANTELKFQLTVFWNAHGI